ncbi:MAG: serine hydroxymethyltransferase [Planctomycetes bacterium]|nr:serine hydroxymethyltransferase [Planctomycetota bacterium]
MLNELQRVDREVYDAVRHEVRRQHIQLEMIASENYVSLAVLEATGSVLTNKYAEGYPGKRYYGGCEYVDICEKFAIDRAKEIFKAEHANVQPHSGTQANMAVYFALLKPGDTILGMDLAAGGHLSHGAKYNFSGKVYKIASYGLNPETERIDYDALRKIAHETKPQMIVAGASAYPRVLDFNKFGEIAKEVGALLMVDIAHIAGLVAAGLHPDPMGVSDVVTTTTHKTMRGPRGGIILCKGAYAKKIDSAVFPGAQGGPLMHVIAAKAVALKEALHPSFKEYQKQIIQNAQTLAAALMARGYRLVSGGTDNHLMLVDLRSRNITGKLASQILDDVGITVNKNLIPNDPLPATETSGVRIGSPALTTRGLKEPEMERIATIIDSALSNPYDRNIHRRLREETLDLCDAFPIYAGILRRLNEQDRGAYDVGHRT